MRRALRFAPFRLWIIASFVGNTGTWMQRVAQDWIVAADLTDGSGAALGLVGALQFLPSLVLSPIVGHLADRYPQRRLIAAAQACGLVVATAQGALMLAGLLELWHVYVLALLLGVVSAFDATLRQTVVDELLPRPLVPVGVSLSATAFTLAALVGPAVSGAVIAGAGAAWAMLANALSYGIMLVVALVVRPGGARGPAARSTAGGLLAGVRFLLARRAVTAMLVPLVVVSAIGMQLPITSPLMASVEFHRSATGYSILTAANALGSLIGSVRATRVPRPTLRFILVCGGLYGAGASVLAVMPSLWTYAAVLVAVGVCTVVFTTACQVFVQMSAPAPIRGRVVAAYIAIYLGTVPAGSLLVGWVVEVSGARWGVAVGGLASLAAVLAVAPWVARAAPPGVAVRRSA